MSRAAELFNRGYRLTPLNGKRPYLKDWPDNPLTVVQVQQEPESVGVILGHDVGAGVIAVDVEGPSKDPEGMKTLADWQQRFPEVFDRPTQSTPSGGMHFIFRLPPEDSGAGLPNGRAAPGVDVLTHRKQVVAYTDNLPSREELPVLPPDVREFLASLSTRNSSSGQNTVSDPAPSFALIEKAVRAVPNTESTSRDEWVRMAHLIRGACGFEYDDQGLELFQEWAAGYPENDPVENERVYLTARPKAGWHALRELADKHGLSLQLEEARAAFAAVPLPIEASSEETDDPWICVADALADPDKLKPAAGRHSPTRLRGPRDAVGRAREGRQVYAGRAGGRGPHGRRRVSG